MNVIVRDLRAGRCPRSMDSVASMSLSLKRPQTRKSDCETLCQQIIDGISHGKLISTFSDVNEVHDVQLMVFENWRAFSI